MSTEQIFDKSAENKPGPKRKRRKPAAKPTAGEKEPLTYGALVVLHTDIPKRRVYIGVDPKKSTSRMEELQSEDAKQLAVKAAVAAGMADASILNQPGIVYFDTNAKQLIKASLASEDHVVLALEVEVTSFGSFGGFVGDSIDVTDVKPLG